MRLHRLQAEAFGPFAAKVEVDFDALTDAGLFLLHGPTGAGKTSLLDAVCFALYGQVPGARAAGRSRLRSDHAAEGVAPRVVLELTVAGRRLEVTRSPEWWRPKKRGAGTTREPARIDVREYGDGRWQVVTVRRSDEAGLLLRELLGMGLEQFTKVVMLPQGEFAAFLRAGAEQRAELLGRLFAIDQYTGAEHWLRAQRQQFAREVADVDAARDALIARAQEMSRLIVGSPVAVDDEMAIADPPGPQVVHALASTAQTAHATAQAEAARARDHAEHTDRAWRSAATLAERVARREELLLQSAALESVGPQHAADAERLDLARRAEQARGALERVTAAASAEQLSGSRLETARLDAAPLLGGPHAVGRADDETVAAALDRRAAALARVDDARAHLAELAAAQARTTALATELEGARAARTQAEQDHAAAGVLLATAEQQLAEHADAAAGAPAAEQALATAEQVLRAARELVPAAAARLMAEDERRAAQDAELAARAAWLDVRERRLAGMAAELAAGLVPGEPCAVCGGVDHPRPAASGADQVDAAAERQAQEAHEAAGRALSAAHEAVEQAAARCAALQVGCGGVSVAEAELRVAAARAAHADALASAEVVTTARQARELAQQAVRAALAAQSTADRRASGAASALAELEPRTADLAAGLRQVLGDDSDLETKEERLRAEATVLRALQTARADAENAASRSGDAMAALSAILAELGFTTPDQARSGLLEPAEVATLAGRVDRHDRQRADLLALLSSPELDGLDGVAAPDLAPLQEAAQQAAAALRAFEQRVTVTDTAATSLRRLTQQLREHDDVHRDLRGRHEQLDALSRCVDGTGGGNARRMRLSAFVLAARLEEVAAAATERLLVMSQGRYSLSHSDDLAKGGVRSGLGLQVIDAWTGAARETCTLSGGESFLASLALALGLADVVHAESGGSTIETLFVDEGFGSLDDDTLEQVMDVLDGLREGGRAVGIVSHVAELRARVSARVEVTKGRTGSAVRQTGVRAERSPAAS